MPNYLVVSLKANDFNVLTYGKNKSPLANLIEKGIDINGSSLISTNDSQFGRVINAERTPLIELKSIYGISELRDVTSTTTGGSILNNATEYQLTIDGSTDSEAILESAERGRYLAGAASEVGIAARLVDNLTGTQEARWGYFDNNNGAFFGQDASGIFIAVLREGSIISKVYQSSWNADKLDGSGFSGYTLDLSNGNIFQLIFTWYGYGTIEFRLVLADSFNVQNAITVHRFRPSGQTSMADPNLPLRAQITNGATADDSRSLYVAGRQYSVLGKYEPNRRITSEYRLELSGVGTTFVPTVSFRRKSAFPIAGRANSVSVKLEGLEIISTENLLFELRFNATTLTGASWQTPSDTQASETALESDKLATGITGGIPIFTGLVTSGKAFSQSLATANNLDLDFNGIEPVTLAVRTVSGTSTVNVVLRVREEW